MQLPEYLENDPWLHPYKAVIEKRLAKARETGQRLGLDQISALGRQHEYYGLHRQTDAWVFREWAPYATELFLIGEFSDWKPLPEYRATALENGNWELILPAEALQKGQLYALHMVWPGGSGKRIPAYARSVVQDENTKLFNAQIWHPETPYQWKHQTPPPVEAPLIYEAHVGMAQEEARIGTYAEFRKNILPRVKEAGYNTLQLMAIQEHPYYGSFGYHVSSFFGVSSRFGSPDELKELIDTAHGMGLRVIMDLVHSHSVKNYEEGLGLFDGSPWQYFHDGPRREHVAWDSLCFNYAKDEVLHFLLSNCRYWLQEYQFDGFRFDGVTSMLYYDHGLNRNFTDFKAYFDGGQDEDALSYLFLANQFIHTLRPDALTIAEEMSGMPGLAIPTEQGGWGFDYRLSMGTPDYWIKTIKERRDEDWNVGEIFFELTNHRADEGSIGYCESHDQALVGDQTLIFRLINKEIYEHMGVHDQNLVVDRGMALHKMIRLITLSCAGKGYLNFMGNEFGHPEWIDFPREGNNWSFFYARRQWSLADNPDLKYAFLKEFDRQLILRCRQDHWFGEHFPYRYMVHEEQQILAYRRAGMLFVFNFNPVQSYTDYGIPVDAGRYRIVLNTDHPDFGGQGRIDEQLIYPTEPEHSGSMVTRNILRLYLPARTGLVFSRQPIPDVHSLED